MIINICVWKIKISKRNRYITLTVERYLLLCNRFKKIYNNFLENMNYSQKHRYESNRGMLFWASYLGTLFRWWAVLLRLGGRTIVDISGYQIEISAHRVVCTLDHDLHSKIHHGQTPAFPAAHGSLSSQRFLLHERAHFLRFAFPSGKHAAQFPRTL